MIYECCIFVKYIKRQQQAEKKDNDTMKFLLRKDKEENMQNATTQKHVCGCPSMQLSLRRATHMLFLPTRKLQIMNLKILMI